MNYTLTETRLLNLESRSIRIELFRNMQSGSFRVLAYELLPSGGIAQSPHSHRHWTTLSYNVEETNDPEGAIAQIVEKLTRGALPDHLGQH